MDPFLTAIVGLVGALIGAGASVVTIAIQAHHQSKRDRMKMVAELAMEDYRSGSAAVRANRGGGTVPPLSLYLDYHASVVRIIETRPLSTADIQSLGKRIEDLIAASPDTRTTGRSERYGAD